MAKGISYHSADGANTASMAGLLHMLETAFAYLDQIAAAIKSRVHNAVGNNHAAVCTYVHTGIAVVGVIDVPSILERYGFPAVFANNGCLTVIALQLRMTVILMPAANTKSRMADMQDPIVFGSSQQRDIAKVFIIGIMQSMAVGRIKLIQFSALVLELPPIWDAKANGDDLLHDVSVLLHQVVGILGILAGLEQHIVLIEKHLPASARRLMEMLLHIRVHRKEDHADFIQHIGDRTSLVFTAV